MQVDSLFRLGEIAGGAFLTGMFNDTLVAPTLEGAVPALQADHTLSKAADTATTFATAYGLGKVGGILSPRLGRALEEGGAILAVMKGFSIAIPGVEVKTTVPSPLSLFRASTATAPATASVPAGATKQLPSGAPGSGAALAQGNGDVYTMTGSGVFVDQPHPSDETLDVGL